MNIETEVMRLPDVIKLTGVGKDSIYKLMRHDPPKFPKNRPMRDMPSRRVWNRSDVLAWINGQ